VWYAPSVDWPERRREGFALAAAARGDRGAQKAAPGLCADVVADATSVALRLSAGDATARRRWVRELLHAPRTWTPDPSATTGTPAHIPPRVLALLATQVDRDLGRRWLEAAPLPRPGFTPEPYLLALLRQLLDGDAWHA
jgi:hypothetical protein